MDKKWETGGRRNNGKLSGFVACHFSFLSPDPVSSQSSTFASAGVICSNSQFASWMRFEPGGLWHALGGGVAPWAFASGVAGAEFYPDFYAGG